MTPGMRRLVTSVAGDLAPAGRFVLFVVTRGEQIVAANALLGAGNELAGWLFGFDERSERLSPFHVTITDAVRHAAARGISRIDLGHGGQAYKGRVATGEETLVWVSLVEPGPGHLMRRASLLPELYREDVSRAVPERIRPQVWRMLNLLARFRRG